MRALAVYAAATGVLLVVLTGVVVVLVGAAEPGAVWLAAGVAWPVQVLAFWVLLKGRGGSAFMLSWATGIALRFGAVAAVALWLARTQAFDPTTGLVSLVGFVFVLVLLEPLFLRLAD